MASRVPLNLDGTMAHATSHPPATSQTRRDGTPVKDVRKPPAGGEQSNIASAAHYRRWTAWTIIKPHVNNYSPTTLPTLPVHNRANDMDGLTVGQ
eukprot:1052246-Pyramimonas_sp.AAC.1